MATPSNKKTNKTSVPQPAHTFREAFKLFCVFGSVCVALGLLVLTPGLSTPSLLSIVVTILLSPIVATCQRKGYPRTLSIFVIFLVLFAVLGVISYWLTTRITQEWGTFIEKIPQYFHQTVARLEVLEKDWKQRVVLMENIPLTHAIVQWGEQTGRWFREHGAGLMGEVLSWIFLVPFISFVLLKDGQKLQKRFFSLVPNRHFEATFMITSQILGGLSDYIRAKLVEALLVGTMTALGLFLVDAPYSLILGAIAGVTNIIPYIGPVIGAMPGLLVPLFDPNYQALLVPMVLVYGVANLVDTVFIFPIIVARLVNLHPLLLLMAILLGQRYYGFVGMLISVPIASSLKVILTQLYAVIYEPVASPTVRPQENLLEDEQEWSSAA